MSDWKPGDVALMGYTNNTWAPVMWQDDELWHDPWGFTFERGVGIRPLVVIDPGSAEQRARLAESIRNVLDRQAWLDVDEAVEIALREFASPTPPKPEEPTGLGAVVEDAEGRLWLRTTVPADDDDNYGKPWTIGGVRKNWQIVDAVRVLSEGVTP